MVNKLEDIRKDIANSIDDLPNSNKGRYSTTILTFECFNERYTGFISYDTINNVYSAKLDVSYKVKVKTIPKDTHNLLKFRCGSKSKFKRIISMLLNDYCDESKSKIKAHLKQIEDENDRVK